MTKTEVKLTADVKLLRAEVKLLRAALQLLTEQMKTQRPITQAVGRPFR